MSLDQPLSWAVSHPWPAAATIGVLVITLVALCTIVVRKTSGAVLTAGIGALVCTAYGGDTSWAFAEHSLHMTDTSERAVMFAAGEVALIACAIMARANKQATATDDKAGTPGVPGVLVWIITGVQVIPAFAESGFWAGIVRATIGPVMGGLLWHLAMGLEIRVARPEALSTGLPAQLAHELRVRLLSYLGLAVRGLTAEQVTRRRAAARAVRLASRKYLGWWGRAALKAAVARSGAATDGTQRHELLQLLAARRNAAELRTLPVPSPWVAPALPEPYPPTEAAPTTPAPTEETAPEPTAAPVLGQLEHAYPAEEPQASVGQVGAEVAVALPASATRPGSTRPAVHARVPHVPNAPENAVDFIRRPAAEERATAATQPPTRSEVAPLPQTTPLPEQSGSPALNGHAALLSRARTVDAEHRRDHDGQPASVATLKNQLRVGQPKAQLIRDLLAAEAGSAR